MHRTVEWFFGNYFPSEALTETCYLEMRSANTKVLKIGSCISLRSLSILSEKETVRFVAASCSYRRDSKFVLSSYSCVRSLRTSLSVGFPVVTFIGPRGPNPDLLRLGLSPPMEK
jgi:hypothetical protein